MEDSKTVWCGNLDDQVTEELLYELFLQVAPLQRVKIPADKEGRKSNYGFITFKHEVSVPYAVQLLNGTRMFEKILNIKPRNGGTQQDKQNAHQIKMQRSFSYPNEAHSQVWEHQHIRFNDAADMGPQYINYENLIPMGQLMNINYNYQDNYGNQYGSHEHGHNKDNDRQQWERNSHRDKDIDRDRKQHNRSRSDYEKEKDRRHDYSNNSRNHNRRNKDRNNHHFDRKGGRRHFKHF